MCAVAALRGDHVVNRLVTVDYSGTGGGLDDQWYQEGCFALDDDEALLIETRLDPDCRRFSLSLTDALFSTIDWANAHSSLNRHQAVVEPDGVLRSAPTTQSGQNRPGHHRSPRCHAVPVAGTARRRAPGAEGGGRR